MRRMVSRLMTAVMAAVAFWLGTVFADRQRLDETVFCISPESGIVLPAGTYSTNAGNLMDVQQLLWELPQSLADALTGEKREQLRFFLLDQLGKLEILVAEAGK